MMLKVFLVQGSVVQSFVSLASLLVRFIKHVAKLKKESNLEVTND